MYPKGRLRASGPFLSAYIPQLLREWDIVHVSETRIRQYDGAYSVLKETNADVSTSKV
jgi:hypothetical protein